MSISWDLLFMTYTKYTLLSQLASPVLEFCRVIFSDRPLDSISSQFSVSNVRERSSVYTEFYGDDTMVIQHQSCF